MELNPLSPEYIRLAVGSEFTISEQAILTIQRMFNDSFSNLWTVASVDDIYKKINSMFPNDYGKMLIQNVEKTYKNSSFSLSDEDLLNKLLYTEGRIIINTCIDGAIQNAKLWYSLNINSYDIYVSVFQNDNLKKISKEQPDSSILDDSYISYKSGIYIEDMITTLLNPITMERGSIIIIYNMEYKYKKWINEKIVALRRDNKLNTEIEKMYQDSISNFTTNFINSYKTNLYTDINIYNIFGAYNSITNDPDVKEFVSKILYGISS
jgi:hypothetical protein